MRQSFPGSWLVRSGCTLGLISSCWLAGCGEESGVTAGQADLNQAIRLIGEAERRFADQTAVSELGADVGAARRAHRQEHLKEAAARLESAVRSGTPAEQVAARRLLADIYASQAQESRRQALIDSGHLRQQTVRLYGHLTEVDRAVARQKLMDRRGEIEAEARALEAEAKRHDDARETFTRQIAQLQQQRDQQAARVQAARQEAHRLAAEAEKLRAQAFAAEGEARFDLANEAAEMDRKAEAAGFEADRHQLELEVIELNMVPLQDWRQLRQVAATELRSQQAASRQEIQTLASGLQEAQATEKAALQRLEEAFVQLDEHFIQQVDARFQEAAQSIGAAIEQLQTAAGAAGRNRQEVDVEQAAKLLEQATLFTQYALAVRAYADTLHGVTASVREIVPGAAEALVNRQAELASASAAAQAEAAAVISTGEQLAEQIRSALAEGSQAERRRLLDRLIRQFGVLREQGGRLS